MDIASILGVFAGLGLVVTSILLNSGLDLFWNAPSAMVVIGGTAAATFVAYPVNEVMRVMGLFMKVFLVKKTDLSELIDNMVMINNVARKGGILAIESKLKDVKHEFLEKGLQLTVDGKDEATVAALLKREIVQLQKSHKDGWEIFNEMGKYAPAFGMIGTLIGLVQMLADLADVGSVGPKMAVALITTFYGAVVANLFFIPMTVKLKRRSATDTLEMNLVLEGIMYIRKGVNPRFMKDVLENTVANILGKKVKKEDGGKGGKKK
jgi:chemotaxis protein MotA